MDDHRRSRSVSCQPWASLLEEAQPPPQSNFPFLVHSFGVSYDRRGYRIL